MAVAPRADLVDFPGYVPGGELPDAIILASNEVAYAPPPTVVAALCEAATGVNRYPGYQVPRSQANFVWLTLGDRASRFNDHCLSRNIVVRAFPGEGVRITIGMPAENDAFLAAARAFPD